MKLKNAAIVAVPLSILALVFVLSCGGGGSSSTPTSSGNTVTISGNVGSSYTVVSEPSLLDRFFALLSSDRAIAAGPQVDKVWGLPTVDGEVSPESFQYKVEIPINSDGTFSVDLPKSVSVDMDGSTVTLDLDWILLLINSQATTKQDMIVGYIALSDLSDSLLWMPISSASANIDLGTLSQVGNEARSTTTLSDAASAFTFSLDQLRQIAKTDDVLKNIKNVFANYDQSTGKYWLLEPYFGWSDVPSSIKNQWSDPANLQFYGYAFYMPTNNTSNPTFTEICNGTKTLKLYPPAAVHLLDNSATFDANNPIYTESGQIDQRQDGSQECGGTYFYLRDDTQNSQAQMNWYMYNFIVGDDNLLAPDTQTQPIPSGYWTLKLDDGTQETTVATFDLAVASPFDSSGNPVIFMPSLNVTVDANDNITSIQLKFYTYDSQNNSWVEVTDSQVLEQMLTAIWVGINDYDGTTGNGGQRIEENYEIISPDPTVPSQSLSLPITINASDLNYSWKFTGNTSTTEPVADSIDVGYMMGGVSFRFVWR